MDDAPGVKEGIIASTMIRHAIIVCEYEEKANYWYHDFLCK